MRVLRTLALAGLLSCGGTDPGQVELVAAPDVLTLSDAQPRGTLFLSTKPSGGRLEWEVVQKPAWLTMTAANGTVSDHVVEVPVELAGLDTMPAGDVYGILELISNGGRAQVQIVAVVQADPRPELSVTALAIGATEDTGRVTLRNAGRGTLTGTLSAAAPWLTVEPSSIWLEQGQSVELRVPVTRATLPVGTSGTSLTLASNARAGDVVLPVSVVVSPAPRAETSPSRLGYPQGVSQREFWLRNTGRGVLSWQGVPSAGWVTLAPASGEVAQGDSLLVSASVTRAAVPSGGSATVTLTSNAITGALALPVLVTTVSGFEPGLTVLDHRVVDAEQSSAADLLVTVSADPARLHILDLVAGTTTAVPLSLPPTCVAVRPDGAFAAVGHDGAISLVDLRAGTVTRVYAVSAIVHDLVLASNGWAYAFPREDQWVDVHSVELATGKEVLTGFLYERAQARLHPSGTAIYDATTQSFPSDFEKFDIGSGPAQRLYDSPYHGDYDFAGDIWISADGARLFARSGNVFRASSVPSEDMRYAGSLSGSGLVRGVSDTRANPRLFVLGEATPHAIRIYDRSNLAVRGSAPLPDFPDPGGPVASEGRFVFANLAGDRVYVLAQADVDAGLALDWGLVTFETAGLP